MKKVAVITGACRGIGRAFALRFAQDYNLALISRTKNKACNELMEELYARGVNFEFYEADISHEAQVIRAFEEIKEDFGQVDLLINNAGITRDGTLLRMKSEDFSDVLDVNLLGSFFCAREAIKLMVRRRQGVVLNISSVVGIYGNPGQANYASSKAGVIALSKTLAKEYGSRNIRVNALAPGFIESDMTDVLGEDYKKAVLEKISLARLGQPEEVAELAYFLASDQAAYITGQVLAIDGGISL